MLPAPRSSRRLAAITASALGALSLGSACAAGDDAPADAFVARDSAGVAIAENSSPALAAPFRLAAEPSLVIGGAEDSADPLFRVRGALCLADGGVIVANGGASQLRYYAPDGTLRKSVGARGGGPGEFQSLHWLGMLPGDTALAFDLQTRSYTLFDASGAVVRTYQTTSRSSHRPLGIAPGGAVLAIMSSIGGGPPPDGVMRDSVRVVHIAADGTVGDTLARVPADERLVRISPQMVEIIVPPFARRLVAATTADGGFWVLRDGDFELARHAPDGRVDRLVRLQGIGRAPTTAMLEAAIERQTASTSDPAARLARAERLRALPMPDRLPAASRLLLDRAGNLWVQEFVAPGDGAATWRVFGPDGRHLGALTMPDRLTVYEVGDDYVVGVYMDEDDVEQVRVYELVRG